MAAELVFAPEVQRDLDQTYDWYEERLPRFGRGVLELC